MDVNDLNDAAVSQLFAKVARGLADSSLDVQQAVLEDLVEADAHLHRGILEVVLERLDILDEDDALGTEGWRHAFGVSA